MTNRLINSTIDKDNNIIVIIRKYGWLTCLFHLDSCPGSLGV